MRTPRGEHPMDPNQDYHMIGGVLVPVTPHAADSPPSRSRPAPRAAAKKPKPTKAHAESRSES
jgi:hypothetical protein